nr:Na+/H+ antiporter subunit E [Halorussus halobius]
MIRRWPVIGVGFAALWVLVRGVDLAADAVLARFLTGLAVGLPVAFVFRRLYADEIDVRRFLRTLPYVGLYVLVFLREIVVANLDVAYRVLAPSSPIEPQVILVPLRVETELGVTTIANSITITPGTITLDHDPDQNALYVHVIDGRDPAAIVDPIRTWEDYALVFLDEKHAPGEPAPEFRVHPPDEHLPPELRGSEPASESEAESPPEPRGSEPTDARERPDDGGDGDGR